MLLETQVYGMSYNIISATIINILLCRLGQVAAIAACLHVIHAVYQQVFPLSNGALWVAYVTKARSRIWTKSNKIDIIIQLLYRFGRVAAIATCLHVIQALDKQVFPLSNRAL